jgi:cysteinyl-tRNA synthetase
MNISIKNNASKTYMEAALKEFNELCSVLGILEKDEADADSDVDVALIEELIAKRAAAKKEKNFALADSIRDQLAAMGITIKDTRQGVQWSKTN